MNREKRYKIIAREIDFVDGIMSVRFDDYGEETHRALKEAVEIISALSAEGEYIKKEDATKALSDHFMYLQRLKHDEGNGCKKYEQAGINWCLNTLNELPTYSFPDREKGEWIRIGDNQPMSCDDVYTCSKCKERRYICIPDKINFCPNCGADMRGKAE